MYLGLRTGKTDIFSTFRQLNPHLLTDTFKNLRDPLDLQRIGVPNREHGILMALFGTDRHGAAIGSRPDHLERKIGIMAMHADEDTGFDLIAPDRQIRMVRIDHLFRINLWILRTIVRHRNNHHFGNLCSYFQCRFCFFYRVIVPSPQEQGTREKRCIRARQHFSSHFFNNNFLVWFKEAIVQPLPRIWQVDT